MDTSNPKYNIYLGGPIFNRSDDDCKNWRNTVKKELEDVANCIDPMRRDYRGKTHLPGMDSEIVELDKEDIDGSDALLVYYDKPSVGTSMEILYAYDRLLKIVVVNASDQDYLSPWLTYHASLIFDGLDEAIDFLKEDGLGFNWTKMEEVGVWSDDEGIE